MQFYEQIQIFGHLMMIENLMPLPISENGPSEQIELTSLSTHPPRAAYCTLLKLI